MLVQHATAVSSYALPAGRNAEDFSRDLTQAIHNGGISVYCQDLELLVTWAQNLPVLWAEGCHEGSKDEDFLPLGEAEQLGRIKRRVLSSGQRETIEISVGHDGGSRWFDVWIDPVDRLDGTRRGVLTTLIETTDHKHREQTLKSLLREVSHRSKNLLAIIQSVATQTGRYSGTIETFLARFRGRLQSLAASQDLVTLSDWRGADLKELVSKQVGRYAADPRASVKLTGVNPYLNPNAALHVGLALHELAVNSMSYGALSTPGGSVAIDSRYDSGADGQRSFTLSWSEAIPVKNETTQEKRFGSVALERVVPASLRGSAELTLARETLSYRLTVPAGAAGVE